MTDSTAETARISQEAKLTILIVEDHSLVRHSLGDLLSILFPQWVVLEAESGEEALALSAQCAPGLVLMDVALPGINGLETTRRLKASIPAALVVILSTYEAAEYEASALSAGASAYVAKRTMHTRLVPVLQELLCARTNSG